MKRVITKYCGYKDKTMSHDDNNSNYAFDTATDIRKRKRRMITGITDV